MATWGPNLIEILITVDYIEDLVLAWSSHNSMARSPALSSNSWEGLSLELFLKLPTGFVSFLFFGFFFSFLMVLELVVWCVCFVVIGCWSYLKELLAKEGFLLISVPHNVTFDHAKAANQVYERFNSCLDTILTTGLPHSNLAPADLVNLPIFSVGHRSVPHFLLSW